MQSQIQDNKILKHEDELTDLSKMPKEQLDAIAAKPAYTQTDAPASTSTTMQSVSMNEVPKEGEENILGSVASIHDQMQPGSFMSPISDRKSGSIENLSTEDKATSTEPGMFKEGANALKEAFHVSKEERADIKNAIVTEAEAFGEAITYFVGVAAEKIEGAYNAAASKVVEVAHTLEHKAVEIQHELGLDSAAGKEMRGVGPTTTELKVSEMKDSMAKKAYLMRKSVKRSLHDGRRDFEKFEKKAAMGAGFAKVYLTQEAKDLKRRAKRFRKDWKKDSKATKEELKASLQAKGRKVDHKYTEFENEAIREAGLTKDIIKKEASNLEQKAKDFGKEAIREAGLTKNIIKKEAAGLEQKAMDFGKEAIREFGLTKNILEKEGRYYQGKAKTYFSELKKENQLAMGSIKEGGKELYEKARQYERDFSEDFQVSDYLRGKANYLRSGARRLFNEISRSTYLSGDKQTKSQDFSSAESREFLLDISAHDWNGNSFESGRFSENSEASKFLLEIPASEWNFSSAESTRQRASLLQNRAQGWMKKASQGFSLAQKRFQTQSGEFEKGARNFFNKDAGNFFNQAAAVGKEVLGELSDAADKTKRYMIEKKSELQFQAELLSKDRFPSKEALAKKEAINNEIRNFHKDSNKENLSQ